MSSPLFNPQIGTQTTVPPPAESAFRELLALVLKQSAKDRQAIAAELSALTGERITLRMLNDWLAPSKGKVRFPASFVRALCEATGDERPLRRLLTTQLLRLIEIGEHSIAAKAHLGRALELITLAKESQHRKPPRRPKG